MEEMMGDWKSSCRSASSIHVSLKIRADMAAPVNNKQTTPCSCLCINVNKQQTHMAQSGEARPFYRGD